MFRSQQPLFSEIPPLICSENVEHFKKSILINKLEHPKMVSHKFFQNFIGLQSDQEIVIDKSLVFNHENCSIYERELPDELFFYILGFLTNQEILKLALVSRNFKNYWNENSILWSGRSVDYSNEIFMYFKPILETPVKTILNYLRFLPKVFESSKEEAKSTHKFLLNSMILLGKDQCGKSTFAKLVSNPNESFNSVYEPTISIEYYNKFQNCNNLPTNFQLRDPGGMIFMMRGVKNLIYCFDLNDMASFNRMKEIMDSSEKPAELPWNVYLQENNMHLIIIGLKRDLARVVPMEQVEELIGEIVEITDDGIPLKDLRVQYFELSSKTDTRRNLILPLLFSQLMSEEFLIEEYYLSNHDQATVRLSIM